MAQKLLYVLTTFEVLFEAYTSKKNIEKCCYRNFYKDAVKNVWA